MAEDRNLLERAQDYLVSGDFDRDARYVLGPHLSKGLSGIAELFGPGADIKAGMDEAERIVPSLREGNVLGALAATGLAAATPLFMVSPGSAKEVREVSEELIPQRLFHGTSNPDIKKFKFSKEGVLGEGVYLTPDPKYASTYATGDTANVIPVTADIKNPLVVQATNVEPSTDVLKALGVPTDKAAKITEKAFDDKGNITKEISTRARKQGYDAVILKNKDGNVQEIVSYKPDNISSAIAARGGKREVSEELIPRQVSKYLPKEKKGLKSVEIDDDLFEDILKTKEGYPVVFYRGIYSSSRRRSAEDTENILKGKPRENYSSFLSDNPHISATYAGKEGFITPFIVKPKRLLEFDNRMSGGRFDFFEFDRQAKMLGPGSVLVVRNVRDTGPRSRGLGSGIDEPKYWRFGGDIYATNDDRVLLSATNPKSREAKLAPIQLSELFSRKIDSVGATSFSGDTYSSFEIPMTKTKFFDNTEKLNPKKESIKFLKQQVTRKGKKLGVPHIALKWDGLRWKPIKSNHEGRHRMIVAEDFLGKNVEVPVNVQLRNKAGNKIPVDELTGNRSGRYYRVKDSEEAKKMLSELEKWKEAPTNAEYMKMPTRVGRRTDEEAEQLLIARRQKLAKERRKKKKGGSVIERNPNNYSPRSI